jgi:hypothetical protein
MRELITTLESLFRQDNKELALIISETLEEI